MEQSSVLSNEELYEKINQGVTIRPENIAILVCAIVIASIGLNLNSGTMLIGAMLISPLMGPVQALGMGLGTFNSQLVKKAIAILAIEAVFAILAAALYFLLSPITYASNEIIARTQPTIWDVIIALVGGVAGMIGVRQRAANNIVPGVAIATALMPPLCVMGYSLYETNWSYFFGAGYLFLLNISFVGIATFIVVRLLRLDYHQKVPQQMITKRQLILIGVALVIIIPSLFSAASLVKKEISQQQVQRFVNQEMSDCYVLDYAVDTQENEITVDTIGANFDENNIKKLQSKLSSYGLKDFQLSILQVANTASLTLQDVDRYLAEKNPSGNTATEQPIKTSSAGNSLQQQMGTLKRQLFAAFPNKIVSISAKLVENRTGELKGVLTITLGEEVDAAGKQKVTDFIDEKLTPGQQKIKIVIEEKV